VETITDYFQPVETVPGMGVRGIKENDGGMNLRMICFNTL
jgi:hypothetical protein